MSYDPIRSKKLITLLIHSIIWGIILLFPIIFLFSEGERNPVRFLDFSTPILFLMIVFYMNYSLIIERYLFRKKVWQFFLANLLLFIACLFFLEQLKELYFNTYVFKPEVHEHMPPHAKMKNILLLRDMMSMILTVGLATAIRMTILWYQSLTEQKEMEKLHFESELNNLKQQLNPHFLFNTLNNIYSLISINQDNAQNAVHQLSGLIRYVLYESDHPKVPLAKDLAFTMNFIKLMSLRLPAHVKLEVEIPEVPEELMVAPLLFISVVENAFKHGVSPDRPSRISIRIQLLAGEIECIVENSNFPKSTGDKSGSGIGLKNLRKRLEMIYPASHRLEMTGDEENYRSLLKIKL